MLDGNKVEVGQLNRWPDVVIGFDDRGEILVSHSRDHFRSNVALRSYFAKALFGFVNGLSTDERKIAEDGGIEQWCSDELKIKSSSTRCFSIAMH